jgi:hypothetical protein
MKARLLNILLNQIVDHNGPIFQIDPAIKLLQLETARHCYKKMPNSKPAMADHYRRAGRITCPGGIMGKERYQGGLNRDLDAA